LKRVFSEIKRIDKELSKKLENYHLASEVTKVWNKIKIFATKEELQGLKSQTLPTLSKMQKQNNQLALESLQNKEIIRNFDLVLLQKASKISLDNLSEKL
jgi:hypothetical protein